MTVIKRRLILLVTGLHARVHRANVLTVENYAGVGHPHGVHGDAGVVSVVAFRDVEENEHRLFALILDLNAVQSVEEPEGGKKKKSLFCAHALFERCNFESLSFTSDFTVSPQMQVIYFIGILCIFFLLLLLFSRNDFLLGTEV